MAAVKKEYGASSSLISHQLAHIRLLPCSPGVHFVPSEPKKSSLLLPETLIKQAQNPKQNKGDLKLKTARPTAS